MYFLCRAALVKREREPSPKALLKYCDRAVEILRDSERMYFLCEILELREQLVKIIELQKELPENTYTEYKVAKEVFDYCYLYVENRVSCLNDAIRIRREMLAKLGLPADHTRTSNEEYLRQMRETLELTLPFNAFLKEGEKYLTYEEQLCILNRMFCLTTTVIRNFV